MPLSTEILGRVCGALWGIAGITTTISGTVVTVVTVLPYYRVTLLFVYEKGFNHVLKMFSRDRALSIDFLSPSPAPPPHMLACKL